MQPRKIVVSNWVHPEITELLRRHGTVEANQTREPWSRAELIARCQGATAMMGFMTESVDDAFLAACPTLKMISCALKGYDNYDIESCRRRGVTLTIVPDLLTNPTAELTVGLMIALGRKILASDRFMRSGAYKGWRPIFYGTGLDGSTVGIVGMGAVGRAIAARLQGFGCSILSYDANPGGQPEDGSWRAKAVSFDEIVAGSDFLVVVLPLSSGTRHMINRDVLRRMKPGALLINTGRGSVVDEPAVAEALADGHLGGFAADVYEMEDWARPDRPDSVLPALLSTSDRTVLTSHIGSAVDRIRFDIAQAAARHIIDFLEGRRPQGIVGHSDIVAAC